MPKAFYTEHDIEDLFKRGVMALEVNDEVVLTDLAYEKVKRLGMSLVQQAADTPPAAPMRPYIARSQPAAPGNLPASPVGSPAQSDTVELRTRIHNAVIARLGTQVDASLLDAIITRVLNSTGIK